MNTLQYLKVPIALVLSVKLWLNQELNRVPKGGSLEPWSPGALEPWSPEISAVEPGAGVQSTSLMPRPLGHLTKLLL